MEPGIQQIGIYNDLCLYCIVFDQETRTNMNEQLSDTAIEALDTCFEGSNELQLIGRTLDFLKNEKNINRIAVHTHNSKVS